MVKHSPVTAPCQSEWSDSKHILRWGPASGKPENRASSKPTPGSQLSLRTVKVISCDKSCFQEATCEFTAFPGAERVHSYLGLPVLHSETRSAEIMHHWLVGPHVLLWNHSLKGTKTNIAPLSVNASAMQFHKALIQFMWMCKWSWSAEHFDWEFKPCEGFVFSILSSWCMQVLSFEGWYK